MRVRIQLGDAISANVWKGESSRRGDKWANIHCIASGGGFVLPDVAHTGTTLGNNVETEKPENVRTRCEYRWTYPSLTQLKHLGQQHRKLSGIVLSQAPVPET